MLLAVLGASPAHADEMEIQLALTPDFTLLQRDGGWYRGGGATIRAGYGLTDFIAADASLQCGRFGALERAGVTRAGRTGNILYDATQCRVMGFAGFRLRGQWALSAGPELGYRFERRSNQAFVTESDILIEKLDASSRNALVAGIKAGLEFRPWDLLGLGLEVDAAKAIAGADHDVEIRLALVISVFFFP
jgi:hypothetical protein